jgi:hypothetical protein
MEIPDAFVAEVVGGVLEFRDDPRIGSFEGGQEVAL